MYNGIATKCITGECRLSYAHLCEPYSSNGGEAKYSVTLLIPKTDAATEADIRAAIQAAYEMGVKSKWKGSRPQLRYPVIYDGDGTRSSGEPFGDECRGCWVVNASSKLKPMVVSQFKRQEQLPSCEIYSGMYGRVSINFYPYDSAGNRGVGCGLGNVMKTRDGEALGGHASAESDFAGIEMPAVELDPITGLPAQPQSACQASGLDPITGLSYTQAL